MKQNPVLLLQMFQVSNSWGIKLSCFSCPQSNVLTTAATARWGFFLRSLKFLFCDLLWITGLNSTDTQFSPVTLQYPCLIQRIWLYISVNA